MLPTLPCYPLHRPRPNPELLGDLVQARPIRRSQGGTDAPFQLGVDEGPTAVLAPGLGNTDDPGRSRGADGAEPRLAPLPGWGRLKACSLDLPQLQLFILAEQLIAPASELICFAKRDIALAKKDITFAERDVALS